MKKIKIFLASSAELKAEREQFELQIYRKCKQWFDRGIFLHLDVWEDLSARMSGTRLQDEYNQVIKQVDLFVLLAHTKVGIYTSEEFEQAFGQFQSTQKPFIYTYFKQSDIPADRANRKQLQSLWAFQDKLDELGHFYSSYNDFNDLWNQFNKELDRLEMDNFVETKATTQKTQVANNVNIQKSKNVIAANQIGNVGGDFIIGDR
ncbi:MAG: hypothetical protein AAF806_12200 [Bacteroidota bacterium]